MSFKSVSATVDFPALEKEILDEWYESGIVHKYLHKNDNSEKKFSYLDGPITANNPMGVHHAWGRTLKDLWQRYHNMKGFAGRFQNGFDEQGLWVEVEVEKELGLKSKKDILNLVPGDEFKSLEKFIILCKERVKKYSAIQTEQSKRLGYFMDWEHSYHTSSDENNYAIWNYLKTVHQKGWLYKGRDSVPWCPRCGTAISQHEILTEDYQELKHESLYFKLPIKGRQKEYLVVWTTTPWTIPGNVAVAVDPKKNYLKIKAGEEIIYLIEARAKVLGYTGGQKVLGKDLVGLEYNAPFDHLPRVAKALGGYIPRVVENDELILLITEEEGTGLVHVAPGAGSEDFKLGQKLNLPVIELIDEEANYLDEMGNFSDQNAKKHPELITNYLKNKDGGKFLFKTEKILHRYPICWRCKKELVWRVVDEWYIAMDKAKGSDKTYREQMVKVAKKINWMPKWGLNRELDWLKNMHDWLISKKRYWGLALPIWECQKCGNFEVIGGKEELREKSVEGWDEFEDHSPHRPWIDQVKIKCPKCGQVSSRIPDVGNPWLDAGIVPFSTLPEDWFPGDLVSESFPGQFKNWFYAMIAMSTALKKTNPFKSLYGYALVKDEKGQEMHKSKGNSIEFNEAADKIGADVMRWMFVTQDPESNLLFGFNTTGEVKRRFYLIFWNCYKFFVDYASLANWSCELARPPGRRPRGGRRLAKLDKWILARLTEVVLLVNDKLEKYDASSASRAIEDFVSNDFSTWYIRRSRDRVGPEASELDRNTCLSVMYGVLVTLTKLSAPFIPFITEEMFKNLTGEESVHLQDYPSGDKSLLSARLIKDMEVLRKIAERLHSKRKEAGIKLRQPLSSATYEGTVKLESNLEQILAEEINVKKIEYVKSSNKDLNIALDTNITRELAQEEKARELIRQIQALRKQLGLTLADKISIEAPNWPEEYKDIILKNTASLEIKKGTELKVSKIS